MNEKILDASTPWITEFPIVPLGICQVVGNLMRFRKRSRWACWGAWTFGMASAGSIPVCIEWWSAEGSILIDLCQREGVDAISVSKGTCGRFWQYHLQFDFDSLSVCAKVFWDQNARLIQKVNYTILYTSPHDFAPSLSILNSKHWHALILCLLLSISL